MRRTVLPTTLEGLSRRLSSTDRATMDLNRRGDWQFDEEVEITPGSTFYVRRTAAFSVANGVTTALEWDGGAFTSGGQLFAQWDAGTPAEVEILASGLYWLAAAMSFNGVITGARYLDVAVNGGGLNAAALGPIEGWATTGFGDQHLSTAIALPLAEGDIVTARVEQTSGGSLGMGASPIPQMSITRFAGDVTTF